MRRCAPFAAGLCLATLAAAAEPLRLSVYATAGDVQRHLATATGRQQVVDVCRTLQISRLFLEGRRGNEYVAPAVLAEARAALATQGLQTSGGIATVPGPQFGTRQDAALDWLNWESESTRRDVASFFRENAPVFPELIVDDFYCTADTSAASAQARGQRSWGEYRRDLLVSLIDPLMVQPTRAAQPGTQLILKFPQWYDRFQQFGYDPPRMAPFFHQIWVGTEVRNPKTRRMGFVQPTQGYMNFRWLTSVAGDQVRGAWFDHIECTPQNFLDQAYLSVLAGARELTLFRLGDLMDNHPGDLLLARHVPELRQLAERIRGQRRAGIAFYKPPGADADENLYLADYLGMLGLPMLPEARYPASAKVVVLAAQAAGDPEILDRMRRHLQTGATVVLTPAFIRRVGPAAAELAGVQVGPASAPATASSLVQGRNSVPLSVPLELDSSLYPAGSRVRLQAEVAGRAVPWLTTRRSGGGRVVVLNVRTFNEQDFREAQEWLLAPKPRGLAELPQPVADALRTTLLGPLRVRLDAPAGVALCAFEHARCLHNFLDRPVTVKLDGQRFALAANQCLWRESR